MERCLSVISDSATTTNLKDFQSCLMGLDAGTEKLSEEELQGIMEVMNIDAWIGSKEKIPVIELLHLCDDLVSVGLFQNLLHWR